MLELFREERAGWGEAGPGLERLDDVAQFFDGVVGVLVDFWEGLLEGVGEVTGVVDSAGGGEFGGRGGGEKEKEG